MSSYTWEWASKWGETGRMEARISAATMRVEHDGGGWLWETITPANASRLVERVSRRFGWAATLEEAQRMAEDAAPSSFSLVGQSAIIEGDGLQWCDVHAEGSPVTWHDAVAFIDRIIDGGWRLPTVEELTGLFDYDRNECRITPRFRPYWTSQEGSTGVAWCVDLALGSVNTRLKGELAGVMLVRDAG